MTTIALTLGFVFVVAAVLIAQIGLVLTLMTIAAILSAVIGVVVILCCAVQWLGRLMRDSNGRGFQ